MSDLMTIQKKKCRCAVKKCWTNICHPVIFRLNLLPRQYLSEKCSPFFLEAPFILKEQIYSWNPEIIYITNFTPVQPEDFYNNTIPGQDWSQVEAVKNKQVYKIPLGIYRWFPPSGDAPLMLKWLANHNQPDLFDYDMNNEIKSYYKDFYGYEVTDEDVEQILHPSSKAAKQ